MIYWARRRRNRKKLAWVGLLSDLPQSSAKTHLPTRKPPTTGGSATTEEAATAAKKSPRKIEITPEDLANANAYLSQIKDYLRGQSLGQLSSQSDKGKKPSETSSPPTNPPPLTQQ